MTTVTLSIIGSSSHVMPTPACAMAGICGCGSLFPLPFLLKEKEQKFKADIIGPNTQSGRFPAMSAVARAPDPVGLWSSRTRHKGRKQH